MSDGGGWVCGFADEATAIVGLAWDLGVRGGLLVLEGETLPATAELAGDGDETTVTLEGKDLSCEATMAPRPRILDLDREGGGASAAICAARVRIQDGDERRLDCAGHLTRWDEDPTAGAGVFRHVAVPGPDRSLLLVSATRPEGAEDHGAERVEAWRLDPEGGASRFGEALLSTQYDDDGLQVRAGVELWPSEDEAPPLRAAGELRRGTAIREGPVAAAALHTSTEGSEGIGSYLLWRR